MRLPKHIKTKEALEKHIAKILNRRLAKALRKADISISDLYKPAGVFKGKFEGHILDRYKNFS